MGRLNHNHYECQSCGKPREITNEFSCTGLCMDCSENNFITALIERNNVKSLAYKRWRLALNVARSGAPKIYTPPQG